MSQELNIQAALRFNKGGASIELNFGSKYLDVAGSVGNKMQQTIGTADEELDYGDVTSKGYLGIKNLDSTNFVSLGQDADDYQIKLRPGGMAIVEWSAAEIHLKADTAPCIVEFALISL